MTPHEQYFTLLSLDMPAIEGLSYSDQHNMWFYQYSTLYEAVMFSDDHVEWLIQGAALSWWRDDLQEWITMEPDHCETTVGSGSTLVIAIIDSLRRRKYGLSDDDSE